MAWAIADKFYCTISRSPFRLMASLMEMILLSGSISNIGESKCDTAISSLRFTLLDLGNGTVSFRGQKPPADGRKIRNASIFASR